MDHRDNVLSDISCGNPAQAIADIVFIHGLGGLNGSWASTSGQLWPRDLLGPDLPQARVFAFEYRADITQFWASSQSILEKRANSLIDSLIKFRDRTQTNDRPIIFVAHSIGGILCKQALASGDNAARRNVVNCTRGFAFFGTPHEIETAKWMERGQTFFDYKQTQYPHDLHAKSERLSRLEKRFLDLLGSRAAGTEKINVICFYEGQDVTVESEGVPPFRVVPQSSACLEQYPSHRIPKNHTDMCKFAGKHDESYRKLLETFQAWIKDMGKASSETGKIIIHAQYDGEFYGAAAIAKADVTGGSPQFGGGTFNFYGKEHARPK